MQLTQPSWKQCMSLLLESTSKFIAKEIRKKKDELHELVNQGEGMELRKHLNEAASSNHTTVGQLKSELEFLSGLFQRQTVTPEDQTEQVTMGNAVTFRTNKGSVVTRFLDNVRLGEKQTRIISLESGLGKAMHGKKVGYFGTYVENGREFNFEILEIHSYSDAKQFLKDPSSLSVAA